MQQGRGGYLVLMEIESNGWLKNFPYDEESMQNQMLRLNF